MSNNDMNELVCPCFDLTKKDIVEAIKAGATSLEALGEATGAGTMCGACIEELEEILKEYTK